MKRSDVLASKSLRVWGILLAVAIWALSVSGVALGAAAGVRTQLPSQLVVPDGEWLLGGQLTEAAANARLASPEAVFARKRSRLSFANLSAGAAARLVSSRFPALVGTPPVTIPQGARLRGYDGDYAARLETAGHKHVLMVSSTPIDTMGSAGARVPVSLALVGSGASYRPSVSPVAARIPRKLSSGIELPDSGVTLVATGPSGAALGAAEGTLDGDSVLFSNTQQSTDTAVKPLATGFETDTVLRSVRSPQTLSFRVQAPAGVSLSLRSRRDGSAKVLENGGVVASIPYPRAFDAAGTNVPVAMRVSGNTLTLVVDHRAGSYQYPILVDPTMIDTSASFKEGGGWAPEESHSAFNILFQESHGGVLEDTDIGTGGLEAGNYGLWGYETQGESYIYEFTSETSSSASWGGLENQLAIVKPPGVIESWQNYGSNYGTTYTQLCGQPGCATGKVESGNESNVAYFQQVIAKREFVSETFKTAMSKMGVYLLQEKGPSGSFLTSSPTITEFGTTYTNVLYANTWLGPNNKSAFYFSASDPGIGIDKTSDKSTPAVPAWEYGENLTCIQCNKYFGKIYWSAMGSGVLPDGEDMVEAKVANAMGSSYAVTAKIKVDSTAPHEFVLSGLPSNMEIGNGIYHPKMSVKDGSGTTPSSGIEYLYMNVDGITREGSKGSCPVGPCTVNGEWTMSGSEYAVGEHELSFKAIDHANNVAVVKYKFFVARPTQPIASGPGSVDPQTGELHLSSTDASIPGGLSELSVSRSYGSMHLTAGSEGPLGPQWDFGIGDAQNLTKLPDGDMLLTNGLGLQAVFASKGVKEFTPPPGDLNLALTESTVEGKAQFQLKDTSGNTTVFTASTAGEGNVWLATKREVANGLYSTITSYQVVGTTVEPTQILAPKPEGVSSCSPELVKGCRALGFAYSTKTTATGDGKSEWGEYEGRLKEITFTAWSPSAAKMTTTGVARYEYDKEGKLRAAWDPRVSPALKTTYGYDAEGHVTAVDLPGEEPWLINYGSITGDPRTGRVLGIVRPSAATALGGASAPVNTAAPTLSTTKPEIGGLVSVTSGTWSNSPLGYAYQWYSCPTSECKAILGATNQSYVPLASEKNATLYAEVRATNGNATASASTAKSLGVKIFAPRYLSQFTAGTVGGANSVASDSAGNIWVAEGALSDKIERYSPTGEKQITVGGPGTGEGQFKRPMGIALDSSGNLWIADSNNNRVEELSSSGTYLKQFGTEGTGNGQFKKPVGVALTKNGYIWVVDSENNRIEEFEAASGKYVKQSGTVGTGEGQFKTPNGIAIDPQGHLWVADTGNNRIEEFTEGGFYMAQYGVEKAQTIAIAPSGNMWIARPPYTIEEMSSKGEVITTFGSEGTGNGQFKALTDVDLAAGAENVLMSIDSSGPRVQQFTIGEWGMPAVPSVGTNALTTFEYHVPVKGTGAPYAMGWPTVGTWGEKHEPLEATAIFPPDEPQSQPAHDYRRAAVYYLDTAGHTVNVATPNGGIETTEYNANNDVVRTLSPDNRAAALKEGAKSEAVSKLLDTQSTYNTAGNQLTSTLGPQHLVKLANGKEVQAREHTVYSYDEGAPSEGGPYNLVTKTTRGAQVEGEAEQDVRTSTSSYSGQENLGWKLRKPTSVTTDPSGLKLTWTAVYEPSTGNVIETKSPAGTTGVSGAEPPVYSSSFGTVGSGEGQLKAPEGLALTAKGELLVTDEKNSRIEVFNEKGEFVKTIGSLGTGVGQMKEPRGVAVDGKGNIWVADTANNRVDEFNEKAEFVRTFGFGVTNGEAKFQICTASCVAGLNGSGAGEFKEEKGIATDSHNNAVVVDTGNNRIEKFNEKGEYQSTWGSSGTGNGQFKEPRGISVAPNGSVWVADMSNNRVEVFSEGGVFENSYGSVGTGNLQFKEPKAIFVDTHGRVWVSDSKNSRVQVLNEKGEYQYQFGSAGTGSGQFKESWGVELDSHGDLFVSDQENNRIQKWTVGSGGDAHDTRTVYYSAVANGKYPNCGEHAEFANLVCETLPVAQPGTGGLPELPVTTYSKYDVWDQAETVTQTVGSTTRTATMTYDAAGRTLTSGISSSVGTALPTVTTEYNPETGETQKLSATVESKTQAVSSKVNKLGEVTNYTDADGNESTFEYEPEKGARLIKANDGMGSQTYSYDETLGAVKEVMDSAAGKFSASYDVEGNLASESYPNGMTASYTLNPLGEETKVEYLKTTHCSTGCTWYSDSEVPSIQNQIATEASTLASQSYKYDAAGRLVEAQETPSGKGCMTRLYGFDEDTNRTSMTTREPGAEGKCATEGGTTVSNSFDSADRLIDSGASYDTFGNITHVPAGDAGGAELTSSFYTNNELATQTQSGETISDQRDPTRRVREIVSTGKTTSTVINHYSGEGEFVAWASEGLEKWTRFIAGVGRRMAAIQRNGEAPVLQIIDLRGNIVGTAALSETETKLLSTNRSTEYGVPTSESPPKYSWQGSSQLAAELPSGVMTMGARSYVPQLGRFLQTDPVPGGSANAYSYVFGDPVNASDPSGAFAAWFKEFAESNATEIVAAAAAREQAALEEAIREREEAEAAAAASMPEEPQEPLGGYAGWLCQDAAETHQEVAGCGGGGGGSAGAGGGGGIKAVAASVKYNACNGHPNPHDKAEGCCLNGKAMAKWEYSPMGKPCDVAPPTKCETQGCRPAYPNGKLDCPDGSYPGVSYLGKPVCMPDGGERPADAW